MVYYLNDYREKNSDQALMFKYKADYLMFDKLDLLKAMLDFSDEKFHLGYLTKDMILKGIPLYELLESKADTRELRMRAAEELRHLKNELSVYYTQVRRQSS